MVHAACFSVAAMDYFPQQNRYFAGGNSLNQTIRFRHLGLDSSFIGALGTDNAGERIVNLLEKASVDISHMYRIEGMTACNEIINDECGERYGIDGAWQNGVYSGFVLNDSDWSYISDFDIWATHADGINYHEALRRKKDNNFLVVDFLHFDDNVLFIDGIDKIDIAYFGGKMDQVDDLLKLSKKYKGIIVLTLGADGSIAIQNGITYRQKALPIGKVVDTTGCGDAFQAGFSATYYSTKDIQRSLLIGSELGKKAALYYGGTPWE